MSTRAKRALYVARRGSAAARIRLTEPEAERLGQDLHPYLAVTRARSRLHECWTIAPKHAPPTNGIPIVQPGLDRSDIAYHLWLDPASRTLCLQPGPLEATLTQCRRLLRVVLQRELLARSGVCMQAALAVARESVAGIAIIGGPRAGKTSLLLAMLGSGHFDYCANDDLTVFGDADERPRGLGWPRAISIRRDTLRRFAPAGSRLHAAVGRARHPNSGATWGSSRLDHRAWLFPDELADATSVTVRADATIRFIVFPRFDSTVLEPRLTPIPADAVARRLEAFVAIAGSRYEHWLDEYFPAPRHAASRRMLRALAHHTAAFDLAQTMECLPQSAALLAALSENGGKAS